MCVVSAIFVVAVLFSVIVLVVGGFRVIGVGVGVEVVGLRRLRDFGRRLEKLKNNLKKVLTMIFFDS